MEKGSASARKQPLPPRRQRIDQKPSAAAGKPPLPPRRQRVDEKASAAARNPPLPLRRKRFNPIIINSHRRPFVCRVDDESSKSPLPPRQRKSSETSNRAWIADQLRSNDRFVKISSKICVSMVRDIYNVRADWPDEFNVDLALYLIARVKTIEHDDHHDSALSLLTDHNRRLVFPFFRHFALLLLSLCKVDGNLWGDRLAHCLVQYIAMKLHSTTKQPDADTDDDASSSLKLKGS